jgi:hypothetical protein
LRKYSFRKPKKEANAREQVGPIFVSDSEEENMRDDLQQHQKCHHNKKSLPRAHSRISPHSN